MTPAAVLILKLAGVGLLVLVATLVARRHGHRMGGLVGGLPLIAGPVTGLLLLAHPALWVRDLAVATLACLPATLLHGVVFAWAAARWGAVASLVSANAAMGLAGVALVAWQPSLGSAAIGAWIALIVAPWLMPRHAAAAVSPPRAPRWDLAVRVAAAVTLAAVLMLGAERLPTGWAGWLLAVPITGNVLPAFARAQSGPAAAQALLRGFQVGLGSFFGFFLVLAIGLSEPWAREGLAVVLVCLAAVLAAPVIGWGLARSRRWLGVG